MGVTSDDQLVEYEVSGYRIDGQSMPVVVNPLVTCGHCVACERGEENLCPDRQLISMPPRPGAFSELFAIPERNVIELPVSIDLKRAALAEPIACGWHAVRLVERMSYQNLSDQCLVVIGGGAVIGYGSFCRALGVELSRWSKIIQAEGRRRWQPASIVFFGSLGFNWFRCRFHN